MLPKIQGQTGGYALSMISGTVGAGLSADSQVFQFWWSSAALKAVIDSVTIDGLGGSATAFTAGFANIKLFVGRGQTAAGSGGTAASLAGNKNKTRAANPASVVGDVRIASTAALTAGANVTLDTQPVGQYAFSVGTATSAQYINERLYLYRSEETHEPLVLTTNEALIITAAVPATGTWQFGVTVNWRETASYQ